MRMPYEIGTTITQEFPAYGDLPSDRHDLIGFIR